MRRRKFLQLAGLGSVVLALPSIALYSTSPEDAAVGIILNELNFLKLERKGVEQFVTDYYKWSGIHKRLRMRLTTKANYFFKIDSDQSDIVRNLINTYLISTDFFQNKMDESRVIKYVGRYNPYKTPCANPFSAIYYPQSAS